MLASIDLTNEGGTDDTILYFVMLKKYSKKAKKSIRSSKAKNNLEIIGRKLKSKTKQSGRDSEKIGQIVGRSYNSERRKTWYI